MDGETLDERLRAVERAITDGTPIPELDDDAALNARLDDVEDDLDEFDERVRDLEAAVQALRGYVGNVRSVNRDVERRADAALSKAERLETDRDEPRRESGRDDVAHETRASAASNAEATRPEPDADRGDVDRADARRSDAGRSDAGRWAVDHPIPEPPRGAVADGGSASSPTLLERVTAWL